LEELTRTLLYETNLSKYFLAYAGNITCYFLNRVLIRPILNKTPYEHFKGRIFHFNCKCFILNNGKENLGKFDAKADEGIFLGYSSHSHAYKTYNERTILIEESVHIVFDESNQELQENSMTDAGDDDLFEIQRQRFDGDGWSERREITKVKEVEIAKAEVVVEPVGSYGLPKEWRVPQI